MLKELSKKDISKIPDFPKDVEVGIISRKSTWLGLGYLLPRSFNNSLPSSNEVKLINAKETINIKSSEINPFKNPRIVNACINFLKKGSF